MLKQFVCVIVDTGNVLVDRHSKEILRSEPKCWTKKMWGSFRELSKNTIIIKHSHSKPLKPL